MVVRKPTYEKWWLDFQGGGWLNGEKQNAVRRKILEDDFLTTRCLYPIGAGNSNIFFWMLTPILFGKWSPIWRAYFSGGWMLRVWLLLNLCFKVGVFVWDFVYESTYSGGTFGTCPNWTLFPMKKIGCLGYIGDETLPSYVGTISFHKPLYVSRH